MNSNFLKPEFNPDINPVDYYNEYHIDDAVEIIKHKHKHQELESDKLLVNFKSAGNDYTSVIEIKDGRFTSSKSIPGGLSNGIEYTPFMVLTKYKFKGNHMAAYQFVNSEKLNAHIEYIRVGVDYFKKITTIDRFGIERSELKRWSKDALATDFDKSIFNNIPRYDTFALMPDNENYTSVSGNMYNLYKEFSHVPKEGDWKWSKAIMEHIFGDQFDLGMKYMQVLYLHPKRILPILVLASQTRHTGKSTFLDWMSQIFGGNMVVINPEDITNSFNSSYSMSNIVGIEETRTDKSHVIEKLKNLSTGKFVNVNQKFVDNYKLPFFGKFIITTNDEKRFMRIDNDEIRFWIRKIQPPKHHNTNINEDLVKEIPAFLYQLKQLPPVDFSASRMVFTPEEISTDSLDIVKQESTSEMYKEIIENLKEYFNDNDKEDEVFITPKIVKDQFFYGNNKFGISYIKRVLTDELGLVPEKNGRYHMLGMGPLMTKTGTPYRVTREMVGVERYTEGKSIPAAENIEEDMSFLGEQTKLNV